MKKVLISVLLFLVALVALDKLILPFYTEIGRQTTVPSVRNLAYEDAVRVLRGSGLRAMKSYNVRYLPDVPPDKVIDQIPEPGSIVKPGRSVFLVLNRTDLPSYPMPELTGRTEDEARQELARIGMVITSVQTQAISDPDQDGRILIQSVPPNVTLRTGSPVSFIVGKLEKEPVGLMRVVVPDVLGMSVDQAKSLLLRNGLAIGVIRDEPSALLVPGTVITQKPTANALVQSGQPVDLSVASEE